MTQIEKLKKVIKNEEKENERLFDKVMFCQDHKFEIEAKVLQKVYDAKRKLLQTIRMYVIEEVLTLD